MSKYTIKEITVNFLIWLRFDHDKFLPFLAKCQYFCRLLQKSDYFLDDKFHQL